MAMDTGSGWRTAGLAVLAGQIAVLAGYRVAPPAGFEPAHTAPEAVDSQVPELQNSTCDAGTDHVWTAQSKVVCEHLLAKSAQVSGTVSSLGKPLPAVRRRSQTSDLVGVSGGCHPASSSRSQVAGRVARAAVCLTCKVPSIGVHWCSPLVTAIVTHLVTRPPVRTLGWVRITGLRVLPWGRWHSGCCGAPWQPCNRTGDR